MSDPITPEETSIVNILMQAIVDKLTSDLIFVPDPDISAEAEAVAGLVRAGKLQADPTIAGINILVHPASEEWPNELYKTSQGVTYEIGGPIPAFQWSAKFYIELKLFFNQELERTTAQIKAQVVLSRAHRAIMRMNATMRDLPKDDFGGKAITVEVVDSFLREGGGVREFIWRGKMRVQFQVHYRMTV